MIQKADEKDVKGIHKLLCILEKEEFDFLIFMQYFCMNLADENIYYYVYKVNNEIVGFISLYEKYTLHHCAKTAEIVELVVDPKYRNQRIGEKLLFHIFNLAKSLELEEIELSTSMYRVDAQRFYERHGFIKNHYNLVKKL